MTNAANLESDFETLFEILSSERFLKMEGTGNEVPLFIKPFSVETSEAVETSVDGLVKRLKTQGIEVLHIDLLELVAEVLEPRDQLSRLREKESSYPKEKLYSMMRRMTDPRTTLVPEIEKRFQEANWDVTVLSGVGSVFPFIRTHSLLENIQPAMVDHPVVMFFPGEYRHEDGTGSSLSLFGRLDHKGYYRAFNLDHYFL